MITNIIIATKWNWKIIECLYVHIKLLLLSWCVFFYVDEKGVYPLLLTVREGEDALFTCDSITIPMWYFKGGNLPDNAYQKNCTTLYIKKTNYTNSGNYECKGSNRMGYPFISRTHLIVLGKFHRKTKRHNFRY